MKNKWATSTGQGIADDGKRRGVSQSKENV
jgi:hypothetical protein